MVWWGFYFVHLAYLIFFFNISDSAAIIVTVSYRRALFGKEEESWESASFIKRSWNALRATCIARSSQCAVRIAGGSEKPDFFVASGVSTRQWITYLQLDFCFITAKSIMWICSILLFLFLLYSIFGYLSTYLLCLKVFSWH